MPRMPAELNALIADFRREQRDDALYQGKAKPRTDADYAVWRAGLADRHVLGDDPDDTDHVSAVEEAVQARIEAARARVARERADRAARGRRRGHGLAARHAAKLAHQDTKGADSVRTPTTDQEADHG